jgi:hypothetical protein
LSVVSHAGANIVTIISGILTEIIFRIDTYLAGYGFSIPLVLAILTLGCIRMLILYTKEETNPPLQSQNERPATADLRPQENHDAAKEIPLKEPIIPVQENRSSDILIFGMAFSFLILWYIVIRLGLNDEHYLLTILILTCITIAVSFLGYISITNKEKREGISSPGILQSFILPLMKSLLLIWGILTAAYFIFKSFSRSLTDKRFLCSI